MHAAQTSAAAQRRPSMQRHEQQRHRAPRRATSSSSSALAHRAEGRQSRSRGKDCPQRSTAVWGGGGRLWKDGRTPKGKRRAAEQGALTGESRAAGGTVRRPCRWPAPAKVLGEALTVCGPSLRHASIFRIPSPRDPRNTPLVGDGSPLAAAPASVAARHACIRRGAGPSCCPVHAYCARLAPSACHSS